MHHSKCHWSHGFWHHLLASGFWQQSPQFIEMSERKMHAAAIYAERIFRMASQKSGTISVLRQILLCKGFLNKVGMCWF